VACVFAAAIPALVAFSREADAASDTTEAPVAVTAPAAIAAPWSSDAAHSFSMLVVGTLLISAGSALRRAA
jgi:hypothetical protein